MEAASDIDTGRLCIHYAIARLLAGLARRAIPIILTVADPAVEIVNYNFMIHQEIWIWEIR